MRYIIISIPYLNEKCWEGPLLSDQMLPSWPIQTSTNLAFFSSFFENAHIFFTSRFQIAIFLGRQTLTSAMVELEKFGTYCLKFLQWLRVKSNIFWNGK